MSSPGRAYKVSESAAAYEKAGFVRLGIPVEEARRLWGPSDYIDSIYMVRMASASDGVASERSS